MQLTNDENAAMKADEINYQIEAMELKAIDEESIEQSDSHDSSQLNSDKSDSM